MEQWKSRQQLTDLLCSLVRYPSITGSEAELEFPQFVHSLLSDYPYFQKHSENLQLHPLSDGRQLLTALVKQEDVSDTVLLLSHFDVVGVDDYGSLKNLAFHPRELTEEMMKRNKDLPSLVQKDMDSSSWLFGRGVMDMKAGLAIHLSMIEKAINGEFTGNLLLVTVPDEEVNSLGMLTALPIIKQYKQEKNLNYLVCINGEPMFSRYPGDSNYYLYSGSIGKVLPGFFCYGKETHVGEPFAGLNANMMISYLSRELELNENFIEENGDEVTPPPVSLMQRDLKEEYSVQTPTTAVAMYNVLYLKQSISEINDKLINAANNARNAIIEHFNNKVDNYSKYDHDFIKPTISIKVFLYEELYDIAIKRYGKKEMERRQNLLISQRQQGDRDFSTLLVQDLASLCKDLGPMIVIFYSPPFYPAVSSHGNSFVRRLVHQVQQLSLDKFKVKLKELEYFPGLSDLSFIGPSNAKGNLMPLVNNLPLQHNGYQIPEEILEDISMPIINMGPLGKDPHQWTERLELEYSFEQLPLLLTETIKAAFK
ncbi:M20/M25/M40 family metallo-hydrolase [Aquibacillus kalidii]|uniref:M20/M25/M40 family metallo-hydrolase n=1 Tax=Aquibacillus kalidii TaxID=2762597 RepID=UPI001645C616|nr:M20/M25/M40 family metallo-hydrolase [Aquibacillus kalidii]